MTPPSTKPCIGCGAHFPQAQSHEFQGPVHDYMDSSPACWYAYGQVLAREYENPGLFAVHRLSVDSYAVQHPGGDSRQAIQSVGVHLARLCLFLERGLTPEDANAAMLRVGKIKDQMIQLQRPRNLGDITVAQILDAQTENDHLRLVHQWAEASWQAWSDHHDIVRRWVDMS